MEWSNEKYLDFIEDYKKSEVLWDVRNSNYKNNRLKRDVLLGLAQKYDLDEDSIKKKIKNLRTAFHREHKRLTNKKSGSGSTKECKKWFAYESLQFILDVIEPRPGTASKIINDTNIEENIETAPDSPMSLEGNVSQNIEADMRPPSTPSTSTSQDYIYEDQTKKKKKRFSNKVPQTENERRAEEAYNFMKNSNKRDDCSTYGEYVGNELRKLSSKSQIYVKHIINNALFKAALGVYDNQLTHGAPISSTSTTVSTPDIDIDLNSNNLSPYDYQNTISTPDIDISNNLCPYDKQNTIRPSEPSPVELYSPHVHIDRNKDEESQSALVQYLDESSSLQNFLIFKK